MIVEAGRYEVTSLDQKRTEEVRYVVFQVVDRVVVAGLMQRIAELTERCAQLEATLEERPR